MRLQILGDPQLMRELQAVRPPALFYMSQCHD